MITDEADRCLRCRFAPRWCICPGERTVVCPFQVDVLLHASEFHRPSSTGRLIHRVVAGARQHLYRRESPPTRGSVALPGHELWILHPRGGAVSPGPPPPNLQVLLLDGSWREAAKMAQVTATWGRLVRLPEAGPSRYRLRATPHPGTYATAESLGLLLETLGLAATAEQLRLQFELHVYAGLRTRGSKAEAAQFLAGSGLPAAFPELLADLNRRRPDTA